MPGIMAVVDQRICKQLVFSLRPFVSGSHLFYLVLPEEYSTWFLLGDYFRIRRIQQFLV